MEIAQLPELAKIYDLNGIRQIITNLKSLKGDNWYIGNELYLGCAMRDAILLGQIDTVAFLLEAGMSANMYVPKFGHDGAKISLLSVAIRSANMHIIRLLVDKIIS